ncbi:MAG: aminotransferase class V-fold PLP-dependent enzyme [Acidobacteriota bacterium]
MSQAKARRPVARREARNAVNTHAPFVFKPATEDWEFEQIHRLNYKTFVEEIPQHQASPALRLVDKFHDENTYLLCLRGRQLVGMLAVRGKRPFSLDHKLPDLHSFLPAGRSACEIRLLAIEKGFRGSRGGRVLAGFMALLRRHFTEQGYDLAIISGTTRQLRLYTRLGFLPFGPLLGNPQAQFQPMYLTLERFEETAPRVHKEPANFLPGPVTMSREVRRAFEQLPQSHRGDAFKQDFQATRQALCDLVNARNVQLFMGSGTLANDVVAAQLSLTQERGIIISNGEFGNRLIDHARRFGLNFEALEFPWGAPVDLAAIRKKLAVRASAWLWCVHCETSSGLICELETLKRLCAEHGVRLCLDCVSSIGTLAVDLSGICLASCSSAKGLRAYPGLSMVFHDHEAPPQPVRLPRCLDLGFYAREQGIPFTFSSNLLQALRAALHGIDWRKRFAATVELSYILRSRLTEMGFRLIGDREDTSPAVMTIALPHHMNSRQMGEALQEGGFLLSYNSEYLYRRNWIQICLMGERKHGEVELLLLALHRFETQSRLLTHAVGMQ